MLVVRQSRLRWGRVLWFLKGTPTRRNFCVATHRLQYVKCILRVHIKFSIQYLQQVSVVPLVEDILGEAGTLLRELSLHSNQVYCGIAFAVFMNRMSAVGRIRRL